MNPDSDLEAKIRPEIDCRIEVVYVVTKFEAGIARLFDGDDTADDDCGVRLFHARGRQIRSDRSPISFLGRKGKPIFQGQSLGDRHAFEILGELLQAKEDKEVLEGI